MDAGGKRVRGLDFAVVPEGLTSKRGNEGLDDIDFSPMKRRKCMDASHTELDPIYHRILTWLVDQQAKSSLPKTLSRLTRAITPMCRVVVQVDATVVFYHLLFNHIITVTEHSDGTVTYGANPEPVRRSFVGFVPEDAPSLPFAEEFVKALEKASAWVLRYLFPSLSYVHSSFFSSFSSFFSFFFLLSLSSFPSSWHELMLISYSNRGLRYFKTPEGILSSIRQLCHVKREVNPEHVLHMLRLRGFISLPPPLPSSPCFPSISSLSFSSSLPLTSSKIYSSTDEVAYDLSRVGSIPLSSPSHYSPSISNDTDSL